MKPMCVVWFVLLAMLLSGCGVYRVEDAGVERVELKASSGAAAVKVVAYGVLGNGCARVGEVTQRREERTFFVTIKTVYDQPFGTGCTLAIGEFQKEVVLNLEGLVDGVYTVDVNGVTETFELEDKGILVASASVFIEGVAAQVLEAAPDVATVRVGVSVTGKLGDPCVELRGTEQRREGGTFKLTLEAVERIDVACPPVAVSFRAFVLLEPKNLTAGSYQVEVGAAEAETINAFFELQEGAAYREAEVSEVEVVPAASFEADVIARGELVGCRTIDGALQRQEGTDVDGLPDDVFTISLISRTVGPCDVGTVPFEEVIPVTAYGSGTYKVNVNGVAQSFTLP